MLFRVPYLWDNKLVVYICVYYFYSLLAYHLLSILDSTVQIACTMHSDFLETKAPKTKDQADTMQRKH
jgi:hypothetical protein